MNERAEAQTAANPIRKVVTMLQNMVKKVEAEGEKEKELFEKYMCYCKTSGGDLAKSISDAGTKMPELEADIKEKTAKKAQLDEDIKQHQVDRAAAKEAMASATTLRTKEAAAYEKESSEDSANIAAVEKATAAIEKGMGGAFLQTATAKVVQQLAEKRHEEDLVSFLSGTQEYAPASGQITGILKTMHDEMTADYNEEKTAEAAAIKAYDELMAAQTKEVNALSKAIEVKMTRVGDLGVAIAQMKNDLGDTAEALVEDKKFLADLEKNCETKSAEWETIVKTRNEELLALSDTIKVLNDDDALELFKKTLPGASASFVQMTVNSVAARARALAVIQNAMQASKFDRHHLDFIALAVQGKKIGFEKVIGMIDEMVATLKTEQQDDDHKKEYCAKEFDLADDKKKSLEKSIADLETAIEDTKEGISTTEADIAALEKTIKALDKSVADATEQRKEENEDFTELMASDAAAKELLSLAKNRLNKFYNPKLYKPAPKTELSAETRIEASISGTEPPTEAPGGIAGTGVTVFAQVSARTQGEVAPPPPPEAVPAYTKKSGENTGVIAMLDLLIKDLDKEMTEGTTGEKEAQKDYETMMADSAEKRTQDSKSLAGKVATKAVTEVALQEHESAAKAAAAEHMATLEYEASLHAECDWLLKYFEVRKEARAGEVDSLKRAKDVLSGADYSLVQTGTG